MSQMAYLGQAIQPEAVGAWQGRVCIFGFCCAVWIVAPQNSSHLPIAHTCMQRNGSPENNYVGMLVCRKLFDCFARVFFHFFPLCHVTLPVLATDVNDASQYKCKYNSVCIV